MQAQPNGAIRVGITTARIDDWSAKPQPAWLRARPWKAPRARDYAPGQYDAGQPIAYSRTDSQAAEGIVTRGVIWSAGPHPHSVWVSPDDYPRSFRFMTLVNVPRDGHGLPHVAYGGYPSPLSMTTLASSTMAAHELAL